MLFPHVEVDAALFVLGALGLIVSIMKRRRTGVCLGLMTLIYGVWIIVWPQSMLWNARLMPFYYICRYLLAAIGAAEIGLWLASTCASAFTPRAKRFVTALTPVIGAAICIVILGMSLRILPGGRIVQKQTSTGSVAAYSWLGLTSTHAAFVDDWAKWNYSGYEGKAAYGEYRGVVETMKKIGDTRGCGRADVGERRRELDQLRHADGADAAAVLDRRLHRLDGGPVLRGLGAPRRTTSSTSSALSAAPSTPGARPAVRPALDVDKGVAVHAAARREVLHGVLAPRRSTGSAQQNRDLTEVATSGPWDVYQVADTDIVAPLTNQPVVVKGADEARKSLAATSSDGLVPRPVAVGRRARRRAARRTGSASRRATRLQQTAVAPVAVSNITTGDDRICFDVDKVGVPCW